MSMRSEYFTTRTTPERLAWLRAEAQRLGIAGVSPLVDSIVRHYIAASQGKQNNSLPETISAFIEAVEEALADDGKIDAFEAAEINKHGGAAIVWISGCPEVRRNV